MTNKTGVSLTPREHQVLTGLIADLSVKQVAYDLGIRPCTVSRHLANARERFEAASNVALVARAIAAGEVELERA